MKANFRTLACLSIAAASLGACKQTAQTSGDEYLMQDDLGSRANGLADAATVIHDARLDTIEHRLAVLEKDDTSKSRSDIDNRLKLIEAEIAYLQDAHASETVQNTSKQPNKQTAN